jgi:hypothetical protein
MFEHLVLTSRQIVERLVELVGTVVTGIIGGVTSERDVSRWMRDGPPAALDARMRFAYRLALLVAERWGPGLVQAWFKGANSMLGDRAPALFLRDDFSEEAQQRLLRTAYRN